MIYAFGHISGTHINPAVSIALWATGRLPAKDMVAYVVAQLVGAFWRRSRVIIVGQRPSTPGWASRCPVTA